MLTQTLICSQYGNFVGMSGYKTIQARTTNATIPSTPTTTPIMAVFMKPAGWCARLGLLNKRSLSRCWPRARSTRSRAFRAAASASHEPAACQLVVQAASGTHNGDRQPDEPGDEHEREEQGHALDHSNEVGVGDDGVPELATNS